MDPGVSSCVSLPDEGQRNTDVGSAWMPRIGFNWPINFVTFAQFSRAEILVYLHSKGSSLVFLV